MKDFKVYQVEGYLTGLVRDASDVRKYYDVASGDVVEFNSRNVWPIEQLSVSIIAEKTGTDFPYTITGWNGANIYLEPDYDPAATPIRTVSWQNDAGTVYGGVYDVTGGKLTVTHIAVDLSALSWTVKYTGSVNKALQATLTNNYRQKFVEPYSENYDYIGTIHATSRLSDPDNMPVGLLSYKSANATDGSVSTSIYIVLPIADTPSGLMVYNNATPSEYTLTPDQITALLGKNAIWADCGDVILMYRVN